MACFVKFHFPSLLMLVTLHGPTPCFSAPCLHNGRCIDVASNNDPDLHFEDINEYKCFCNAMYSGKNCEGKTLIPLEKLQPVDLLSINHTRLQCKGEMQDVRFAS